MKHTLWPHPFSRETTIRLARKGLYGTNHPGRLSPPRPKRVPAGGVVVVVLFIGVCITALRLLKVVL